MQLPGVQGVIVINSDGIQTNINLTLKSELINTRKMIL